MSLSKKIPKFRTEISGFGTQNFGPKFCNFLLRTYSFGVRNLEVICLFESDLILKFLFQVCLNILAFTEDDFGMKMSLFGFAVLKLSHTGIWIFPIGVWASGAQLGPFQTHSLTNSLTAS